MPKLLLIAAVAVGFLTLAGMASATDSVVRPASQVCELIEKLVSQGTVAGAQVVVGGSDTPVIARSFGVRDVRSGVRVDDDTRFCIGSCSKMFAGAVIVSLASDETVGLDTPIDRWLKAFTAPKLVGDRTSRAPTLRELLCHRSGVYSQRNRMTEQQTRWIRDFTLPLAESVDGIAAEALSFEPGSQFAYSGAGYCVLGRVAEVAAGKSFDALLQTRICRPLGLSRTTYFPASDDANNAVGHERLDGRPSAVQRTPHLLGDQHKLALIGGSVYSPAREAAEFARMLLHRGQLGQRRILSTAEWNEMVKPHSPRQGGGYGFGLSVVVDEATGDLKSLSHAGGLFGSFSHIQINLQTQRFGVVTYTGTRTADINTALRQWVD